MNRTDNKSLFRVRTFTLRAFFVVLTFVSVAIGVLVLRAQRQKNAVNWCLERGGFVEFDSTYDFNKHQAVIRPSEPKWFESEAFRHYLTNVTRVDVSCKNSELIPIGNLPQLDRLALRSPKQRHLDALKSLGNLKVLHLDGEKIKSLEQLAALTNLEQFGLTDFDGSDINSLGKLRNLKSIVFTNCRLGDCTALSGLENLLLLTLDRTTFRQEEIEKIKNAIPNCTVQILRPPKQNEIGE